MIQLIYELRKNCCGRVDGTGRDGWRIEGSTRGPRGPKKACTQTFASQGANGVNVVIVTSG